MRDGIPLGTTQVRRDAAPFGWGWGETNMSDLISRASTRRCPNLGRRATYVVIGASCIARGARDRHGADVIVSGFRTDDGIAVAALSSDARCRRELVMRGGAEAQPGVIYHLISQFVARTWFVESAVERRAYLSALSFELALTDWRCFSFAVMSSHIHLGVVAGDAPLKDWLGPAHEAFARWINQRLERVGAVFVRGPEVVAFQPEGVGELINYIHCNPVRAGVVTHPSDSDWTSHRAYLGQAQRPPWLDVERGLALAGFEDGSALDRWMTTKRTTREELEKYRVTPRARRGRPPKAPPQDARPASAPVRERSASATGRDRRDRERPGIKRAA